MNEILTIPDKFYKHLKDNKISVQLLAAFVDCSRQHLDYVLKNKRPLTEAMRIKLNAYLNTDF